MKPKGLLIAVVLLAVLGGLAWWSQQEAGRQPAKTPADATTKILTIPDDQFQEIRIKKVTGEVHRPEAARTASGRSPRPSRCAADQDAVGSHGLHARRRSTPTKSSRRRPPTSSRTACDMPTLDVADRPQGRQDRAPADRRRHAHRLRRLRQAGRTTPRCSPSPASTKTSLDKRPDDLRDKRLLTFDSDKLTRVELQAKGPADRIRQERPERMADPEAAPAARRWLRRWTAWSASCKDAKMDLTATEDAAKEFAAAHQGGHWRPSPMPAARRPSKSARTRTRTSSPRVRPWKASTRSAPISATASKKGVDDFRNKKLFDFGFSDPSQGRGQGRGATPRPATSGRPAARRWTTPASRP